MKTNKLFIFVKLKFRKKGRMIKKFTNILIGIFACMMWINEICHCRNNPSLTIWWPNGPVSEEARLKACGII